MLPLVWSSGKGEKGGEGRRREERGGEGIGIWWLID